MLIRCERSATKTGMYVIGIDSSTQSTKAEVRSLETGELVASGKAPHPPTSPPVSEQDPLAWMDAMTSAIEQLGDARAEVAAISVAGQQHGLVLLAEGRVQQLVTVQAADLGHAVADSPDAGKHHTIGAAQEFRVMGDKDLVGAHVLQGTLHRVEVAHAVIDDRDRAAQG